MTSSRQALFAIALAVALVWAACSSAELAPATSRVRLGPASDAPIRRVVALRSTCAALTTLETSASSSHAPGYAAEPEARSPSGCLALQLDGVDTLVRSELEFRGYSVVDSESLNATTFERRRIERSVDRGYGASQRSETTLEGSRFVDAPPAMQDAILAELGADALLSTRIWIGAGTGMSARRDVEVQAALLHARTGELVWARRCRVEASIETNTGPVMEAARCAVAGVEK